MNDYLNQINVKGVLFDISGGAGSGVTSGEVQTMLEDYTYDKEYIDNLVISGGGMTSGEVQTMIDNSISGLSSDTQIISGDVVELSEKVDKVSGDVIVLSSDVQGLENDLHTLSSNVYTKAQTSGKTELSTAFEAKQDKLSAGTNITIVDNVISAVGGTSGVTSAEVITMIDQSISGKADADDVYEKTETSGATEIQNALDLKLDASAFTESDYYKKSETSGKTELADALDLKQDKLSAGDYITIDSANTISTSGLVTVVDNEVPDYGGNLTFNEFFPAQGSQVTDWDEMPTTLLIKYVSSGHQHANIKVADENGNVYDCTNVSSEYITWVKDRFNCTLTANEGYRIAYLQAYSDDWVYYGAQITQECAPTFSGGQSSWVIENEIEPYIVNLHETKQDKLTAWTNIKIDTDNKISVDPFQSINGADSESAFTPSVKAVYDFVAEHSGSSYTAGSGISIDNNVISTSGLVTVADNEVPVYKAKIGDKHTRYFPASQSATTWNEMAEEAYIAHYDGWYQSIHNVQIYAIISNEDGSEIYNESFTNPQHFTITEDPDNAYNYFVKANDGYRFARIESVTNIYDGDSYHNKDSYIWGYGTMFDGGQSRYVIENEIEPYLATIGQSKQDKLTAGRNIEITESNTINISPSYVVTNYSSSTGYVPSSMAVYNFVAAHSGSTSGEVQTQIDSSISGKADSSDVYTKIETDLNISSAISDASTSILSTVNSMISGDTQPIKNEISLIKLSGITNAEYNTVNKTIDFYNISGTVVDSIDATDFIKDGMVQSVQIVTVDNVQYLRIIFNTDSSTETIDVDLSSIFNPNNYYTKTEVNNLISAKIVCLSEAEWEVQSGATVADTLYLIY